MISNLLRPCGRLLRTDVEYLASGGFWLGIGKAASVLVAFGLSLLYARLVEKEVYGEYRYILSIFGTLGIFAVPGVATAIVRSQARGFDGTFRRGGGIIFFSSFGVTLVGLAVAAWFYAGGRTSLALSLAVASFFVPFVEGLGSWRAYYEGKRLFREKTMRNVVSSVFYGCFMAGAIFLLAQGYVASALVLVVAYLIGNAIPNIIFFLGAWHSVARTAPQETGAVRYGMHLSLLNAPSTIANYLDALLLHAFMGPAALAVYSFAIALPEQLKSVFAMVATVAFPKLSSSVENGALKKTLPQKLIRATIFTTLMVGAYILVAPVLYSVLFPAYGESVFLSQIFALSLIFFPIGIFGTALKAEGNLKKIYIHELSMPILQILLLVTLIPFYGLWGAVIARVAARFVNHGVAFILFVI